MTGHKNRNTYFFLKIVYTFGLIWLSGAVILRIVMNISGLLVGKKATTQVIL